MVNQEFSQTAPTFTILQPKIPWLSESKINFPVSSRFFKVTLWNTGCTCCPQHKVTSTTVVLLLHNDSSTCSVTHRVPWGYLDWWPKSEIHNTLHVIRKRFILENTLVETATIICKGRLQNNITPLKTSTSTGEIWLKQKTISKATTKSSNYYTSGNYKNNIKK